MPDARGAQGFQDLLKALVADFDKAVRTQALRLILRRRHLLLRRRRLSGVKPSRQEALYMLLDVRLRECSMCGERIEGTGQRVEGKRRQQVVDKPQSDLACRVCLAVNVGEADFALVRLGHGLEVG